MDLPDRNFTDAQLNPPAGTQYGPAYLPNLARTVWLNRIPSTVLALLVMDSRESCLFIDRLHTRSPLTNHNRIPLSYLLCFLLACWCMMCWKADLLTLTRLARDSRHCGLISYINMSKICISCIESLVFCA